LLISSVISRSRKKKKRRLFCAALVAGTVSKLEQSILRLRYLWILLTIYFDILQKKISKIIFLIIIDHFCEGNFWFRDFWSNRHLAEGHLTDQHLADAMFGRQKYDPSIHRQWIDRRV